MKARFLAMRIYNGYMTIDDITDPELREEVAIILEDM